MHGTVVIYDTISGKYAYTGSHAINVYIRKPSDSTGFLYSTTTNSFGQYNFSGINPDSGYVVYARLDSNNIHYYGQNVYAPHTITDNLSDSLKMYPAQLNQNGIFYHLLDSAGAALASSKFFVFNSRELWANNDSVGSIYQLTSDAYGRVVQYNVPPGYYFFRAVANYPALLLKNTDSGEVKKDSIFTRTLKVLPATIGLIYYLKDSSNDPLANADFYIFNSIVLFTNADTVGYIYRLKSDISGKVTQLNLDTGTYYINAKLSGVSNLLLKGKDTIHIGENTVITRQLILK